MLYDYAQRISEIDPLLKFRKKFADGMTDVFKVERKGKLYVLKAARNHFDWGIKHLEREIDALKLANHVPGITHLVKTYSDTDFYGSPLLKEFFQGDNLEEVSGVDYKEVQMKMIRVLQQLHYLGIAYLDINRKNVVISPNRRGVRLVDIGLVKFSREVTPTEFERLKQTDIEDLITKI